MKNFKKYIPAIAAILMVVIGFSISYFQNNKPNELNKYTKTYLDVFDTVAQYIGYSETEEEFLEHAEVLNQKLTHYHQLYDIYNSYEGINNLYTINQNAGIAPVEVDQEIIDLLKFSIELYNETDGQINIAMGSVLEIWHEHRTHGINVPDEASLPSMEELEEAAKHTDITNIIIDEEASTVYLADPNMSLDVGSIGKGYAVQMIADYAKELGYDHMLINIGGNVSAIGMKADDTYWKIGIQNPDLNAKNSAIKTITLANQTLVTSGDYQRYYIVDDIEYCHIIDPDTLMPADMFSAVSIITDHSGRADALSTALFNMSYEDGLKLINSLENTEAIWIYEDGTIKYSKNFEDYIVE